MAIQIDVNAGLDQATSSIQASGSVLHVITDVERNTFKIQDVNLMQLISKCMGKAPTNAYLCSPTPWKDLYKTYNWPQVQVNLVVQSASIVGITSTPVIVTTEDFSNGGPTQADYNCSITHDVTETIESNWTSANEISVGQSISYNIGFLGEGAGGETSLSYTKSWGQGGSDSKSFTIGTEAGVTVPLDPGQAVTVELCASKGAMLVRIVYNAYLTGVAAVNYEHPYKGHHFHQIPIGTILAAGNIPNSVQITEDINIGFYANSEIKVVDAATKEIVAFTPVSKQ